MRSQINKQIEKISGIVNTPTTISDKELEQLKEQYQVKTLKQLYQSIQQDIEGIISLTTKIHIATNFQTK